MSYFVQDTDAAYMMKVDLEAKLDGLSDEIEFLRQIYDAVINFYFSVLHTFIQLYVILKQRAFPFFLFWRSSL